MFTLNVGVVNTKNVLELILFEDQRLKEELNKPKPSRTQRRSNRKQTKHLTADKDIPWSREKGKREATNTPRG
jgi:hypothetical protein